MAKVAPELILDASQLPETSKPNSVDILSEPTTVPPRQLPKPLADFKKYVESKFCYHPVALDTAELVNVQAKVAYYCHMKVLLETRDVKWKKVPATWTHEKVLHSETLGRLLESTTRGGEPVGDMWDYAIPIPASDNAKVDKSLSHCNYSSRCGGCRGKGLVTCHASNCGGSGRVTCSACNGMVRQETSTQIIVCSCGDGKMRCSSCGGSGKVRCSECKGYGGFYHSATLNVKWYSIATTKYYQNSFLPNKRIRKAERKLFWLNQQQPWSKESSIYQFFQSLQSDEANEGIQLNGNLQTQYQQELLRPSTRKNNRMRRLVCRVERLDFEEVKYSLDEKYANKKDSTLGNNFRFCQYPVHGKGLVIYENDYPLNCCGCFGERFACYSCCCTIL